MSKPIESVKKLLERRLKRNSYPSWFLIALLSNYRENKHNIKKLLEKGISPGWNFSVDSIKSSDTLFILGSGSSINEITDSQWEKISSKDSVGLNFWMVHDFVPTFYVFEYGSRKEVFHEILNEKQTHYEEVPFFVKDPAASKEMDLEDIPQNIRSNLHFYFDLSIPSYNRKTCERALYYLCRMGFFEQKAMPKYIFKKRASISYLISLAVIWGYDEIVLLGVDLNNTQYFYEEDENYYKSKGIPVPETKQTGDIHKTIDPEYGNLTIDDVVMAQRDTVLNYHNTKLYIGSKTSALYPELPYYFG